MNKEGLDVPKNRGQGAQDFFHEWEEYEKGNAEAKRHLYEILRNVSEKKYEVEFPHGKSVAIKNERGEIVFFTDDPKRDLPVWFDQFGYEKANEAFESGE